MVPPAKVRALFLDRDGVMNHEVGYLHRAEDVRWIDGIVPLCRTAQSMSYKIIVVTNQSGIARGYYTEQHFHDLMAWMRSELAACGVTVDGVYYCPYHAEHGIGEYRREHEDRKPGIGMFKRAALDHYIDLKRSIMVGDRCSDIAAANAAGLRQAFLLRGTETTFCSGEYQTVDSLVDVEDWIKAANDPR